MREEMNNLLEINEDRDTICQNSWNSMKAVLKGKFIASNAYTIKYHKYQINNAMQNIQAI